MQRSRLVWPLGLALSLSGCAGISQNLVARPTDGSRPTSRLLAWRDRQAPQTAPASKPTTTTPSTSNSDEESNTGSMAATSPARASGEPAPPSSRFLGRSARVFPGLGRWTGGSQAKAELVHPAGNDVWADWARRNAQAKAQGTRNRERAVEHSTETVVAERPEAVTEAEDAILPVALQVGTHAPIGRPRLASPPSMSRPRAGAPAESDPETLPATLPDAVEADQGDGVKRTSAEEVASPLTYQPPAPDQPAQAPSPRTAPPPRPKPSTAPETAPEAAPKPATAPEPNAPVAANPAATPETAPTPAAEPAAAMPTPTIPATESPASTEPTPAPQSQDVAPTPQIAAAAPAAPGKIKPMAAPAAAKKTLPAAAAPAIPALPTKSLPAAVAPSAPAKVAPSGVAPSPQGHVPSHKKPLLLAKIHQWKMAKLKLKPTVFAAPAPPKALTPAPASPVSPQAQAMSGYTYAGGYLSSIPLYPTSYYTHPGADTSAGAARRYPPPTTPVGPTDIHVATASATATAAVTVTKPGQWTAAVPKPASAVKGPRISLFSRFSSWARGDEIEVDRHPLNCKCGDHPRVVPGAPASSLPVSPSIPAESGNLSKAGESVERVATERLDEASQR